MTNNLQPRASSQPASALEYEPDPFRRSIFFIWMVLCWLATLTLLVLALMLLEPLFFYFFLPVCAYAISQTKRWFIPDESEYWKQQGMRKVAEDWLISQSHGSPPNHDKDADQVDRQNSITKAGNAASLPVSFSPIPTNSPVCPKCTAVLKPWKEGEQQQTCPQCSRVISLP